MNISVILTGGIGKRMSQNLPKQFIKIYDVEVFIYTLNAFLNNDNIDRCVLVINSAFKEDYESILKRHNLSDKVEICFGGLTRQESSFNAIRYLKENGGSDEDIVLIHDGARPLIGDEIINQNIALCKYGTAVSTIVSTFDTLVDKDYNLIDRNKVFSVQTPQTFTLKDAFNMHVAAISDGVVSASDDIQLAKRLSMNISFANGSRKNIKMTTLEDIDIIKCFLRK